MCAPCKRRAARGVTHKELDRGEGVMDELVGPSFPHHWYRSTPLQCRVCGTWYMYRYHFAIHVTGEWHEDYLWRLPPSAAPLSVVFDPETTSEDRESALAALLSSTVPSVQLAGACAAWWTAMRKGRVPLANAVARLVSRDPNVAACAFEALLVVARDAEGAQALAQALRRSRVPRSAGYRIQLESEIEQPAPESSWITAIRRPS